MRAQSGLIIHEWVERWGGAERVLQAMADAFPDADVRVLWSDAPELFDRTVTESWLARTPLRHHKALALPAMLPTWRLPLGSDPDWVLVSSHLFAHHVRTPKATKKFVYTHTPARYIWEPDRDRRGRNPFVRAASAALKPIDRHRSAEATSIAVNSSFTGERVRNAWHQPSRVIYPPVDTELLTAIDDWRTPLVDSEQRLLDSLKRPYLFGASRFVTYKRLHKVIEAGVATGLPVVIAGAGPSEARLRSLAVELGADVTFVISPSNELIRALYANAVAYVFPAVEDFGIMPVEAMACGTPVIGSDIGGVHESVTLVGGGITADLDHGTDWNDLLQRATDLDPADFRQRTLAFSRARFIGQIQDWVAEQA
ncbi:Glycosyltransferase involved in cell wall bisynthesis [Microbacterium sp. cf046]|uniref:glycosyltransferase n=1 Tax=Microbacterium sp. cf046 TaxID=1761803 RepID=UPI0008E138BD|nr:glycosyltransferase [Microbacterium sp. cf046]SFR94567.1 Glycosyltransferase involved in cell wall bisynthesis [Microbacterium sp. cf046]